jgi:glycosyltransferase involved in cell wall biosynthesis
MTRDGFDAERIRIVYNGIDEEKYTQVTVNREELLPDTSSKEKLIIMVANMHVGVKGHSDLIEAARTVREICPEARFLLAGDGEMRPFFEDQVKAAGLERTFAFLGHRTDIPALLSCCDIGVLASRSEGLPNVVLEYMAAALPVVATAVGGVPEIIENEESGLLVPPENPAALSAAILRVLKDDELRKRLGKAGRERVLADFNFTRVIGNLKHLYEGRPRSLTRRPDIRAGSLSQVNSSHENL